MIDFLVIGVQKSATSWLYGCLSEHPEINLPLKKREIAYIGGPHYRRNGGIDWFQKRYKYKKSASITGDVSVEYIFNKESLSSILSINTKCKFIVVLRNPAERFVSAINWYVRKGLINQAMSDVTIEELVKLIDKKDEIIYDDLIKRGIYWEQIQPYLALIDSNPLHIVIYDEIVKDPLKTIKKIFEFLEIDSEFNPKSLSTKPKMNSNNKLLVFLERRFNKYQFINKILDILHQVFPISNKSSKNDVYDYVKHIYREHNIRLVELLTKTKNYSNQVRIIEKHWL